MAYVYGLRAADSSVYFYIGSTKNAPQYRLHQHLQGIQLGACLNQHLAHKVNKIGAPNVVIEVIEECSEVSRFEREYVIIQEYMARGVRLCNIKHTPQSYEIQRLRDEFDEYELQPHHIEAIIQAYENGVERTGDPLADAITLTAKALIEDHSWGFLQLALEAFSRHYDEPEVNRQTANLYKRVSKALQRD